MKRIHFIILFLAAAMIFSACSNIPQAPTATPTMSAEEIMIAAQETAEAMRRETETQWAIENPSPTPTETPPPTPEPTATSAIPQIPPTATEEPRPMLRVGENKSVTLYDKDDHTNYTFVPFTNLYIEICYTNEGSLAWNENYYAMCTSHKGDTIFPNEPVRVGKTVNTGEKACFSFERVGASNTALGNHCATFQLYTDGGAAMRNGAVSACWTIN